MPIGKMKSSGGRSSISSQHSISGSHGAPLPLSKIKSSGASPSQRAIHFTSQGLKRGSVQSVTSVRSVFSELATTGQTVQVVPRASVRSDASKGTTSGTSLEVMKSRSKSIAMNLLVSQDMLPTERKPQIINMNKDLSKTLTTCQLEITDTSMQEGMKVIDVLLENEDSHCSGRKALIDAGSALHVFELRLMRALVGFNIFFIPYLLAFREHFMGVDKPAPDANTLAFLLVFDVMYAMCVVFEFFVAQIHKGSGKVSYSLEKIFQYKVRTPHLYADLISLLPFFPHFAVCVMGQGGEQLSYTQLEFAHLRMFGFWRIVSSNQNFLLRSRSHKWKLLLENVDLVLITIVLAHWGACIWLAAKLRPPEDEQSPYVYSLYEAALLMVGQSKTRKKMSGIPERKDIERVSTIILGLTGYVWMSYFLAAVFVAFDQAEALSVVVGEKQGLVHNALLQLQVPSNLYKRIQRYHEFVDTHHSPAAYTTLFNGLSAPLLAEMKLCLFRDLIEKAEFFHSCEPQQITDLVQVLEEFTYSPGDFVIFKGEQDIPAMYFIIRGQIELVGDGQTVVQTLNGGNYFGELVLLLPHRPRTYWARAKTYCFLAKLYKSDFDRICLNGNSSQQFSDILEHLLEESTTRDFDDATQSCLLRMKTNLSLGKDPLLTSSMSEKGDAEQLFHKTSIVPQAQPGSQKVFPVAGFESQELSCSEAPSQPLTIRSSIRSSIPEDDVFEEVADIAESRASVSSMISSVQAQLRGPHDRLINPDEETVRQIIRKVLHQELFSVLSAQVAELVSQSTDAATSSPQGFNFNRLKAYKDP